MRTFVKILLLTSLFCSVRADAEFKPIEVVNDLHRSLLEIMRAGNGKSPLEKYALLEPTVSESFDFPKIARLVTGRHWKTAEKKEQLEFEKSLIRIAISSYISNFNSYSGHRFEIIKEIASGKKAMIETSLIDSKNDSIKIKYMLQKKERRWLIINVIAEGVSDLSLKRADYAQFLDSNPLRSLTKKLSDRAQKGLSDPSLN